MNRNGRSASAIYAVGAILCSVAPALAFTTIERAVVVWSYVLLAGVPLSIMAILLALIHAQRVLVDPVYRTTAIVWAAGALLVLTPFDLWVPIQGVFVGRWARAIATALVALLFLRITLRAWKLPARGRILTMLGFGSVAMFFGYRAVRYIFPTNSTGLEAASEALAEFFRDAVFACLLLLPELVAGWVVRGRVHERLNGRLTGVCSRRR